MHFGDEALKEKLTESVPYIAFIGFGIVGILALCNAIVRNRQNQNCI